MGGVVTDLFRAVVFAMFPRRNPTPDQAFTHQATVSGVVLMLLGGYAWALGLLVSLGLGTGFAKASDLDAMQKSQVFVEKMVLNQNIRSIRKDQCLAYNKGDQMALKANTDNLEGLKDSYRDIVRQEPHVPECNEVIVPVPKNPPSGG